MNSIKLKYPLLFLFYGLLIFLTLNKHSKSEIFTYHAEIWADKAGYYVYLPATFIYNWNGNLMPDSVAEKTGNGFSIEKGGKIRTKYPVGVAIMQAPFFILTHLWTSVFLPDLANGFSIYYNRMIDWAGVTYAFFGVVFLYLFLRFRFDKKIALLTVFFIFTGTNALYYAIDETGMSHIYSFFLFSVFLYTFSKTDFNKVNYKKWIVLGLIAGLILAVRSINILFFPIAVFFNSTFNISNIKKNLPGLLLGLFSGLLILVPQFLYWKYVSGSYIMDSYEGEGFDFSDPQIVKFWFSTLNGLFAYTPLWFFILIGLYFYRKENKVMSVALITSFFILSYIFSSWWSWNFGCGYGMRPMVEFLTVYSVGLASFINVIINKNNYLKYIVLIIFAGLIYLSINGFYHFDGCWYHGEWDYKMLWEMLTHS
jgi:hypothetical protein